MKNKIILCFLLSFTIMIYTTFCFANEEIVGGSTGNAINETKNIVRDTVDGTKNVTHNIASGFENATESVVNDVSNISSDAANGTRNIANNMDNMKDALSTNAMSANTFMGIDTTTWWCIIIAIIVVLIVALIWHYSNHPREED